MKFFVFDGKKESSADPSFCCDLIQRNSSGFTRFLETCTQIGHVAGKAPFSFDLQKIIRNRRYPGQLLLWSVFATVRAGFACQKDSLPWMAQRKNPKI